MISVEGAALETSRGDLGIWGPREAPRGCTDREIRWLCVAREMWPARGLLLAGCVGDGRGPQCGLGEASGLVTLRLRRWGHGCGGAMDAVDCGTHSFQCWRSAVELCVDRDAIA